MSRKYRHQHDLERRFEHTQAKPAPFCADCGYRLDTEEHAQLCEQGAGEASAWVALRPCAQAAGAAMTRYVPQAGSDDHLLHTGPVSDRDHYEERHRAALAEEQRRAAVTVAVNARDAEDCRALLAMLGLLVNED